MVCGYFILPEPASYVFFYAIFNLRNLFYLIPFTMAKQKKPVHRVEMTEGKRNIIRQLLEEYDIHSKWKS